MPSDATTDRVVTLNGLHFHYRDWVGPGDGDTALVLLHGATLHAHSWDSLASAMIDRYRVLALDQRGHGESGWGPAEQYTAETFVEDLRQFVQAMGLERFSLLGYSLGAFVSLLYAGDRPAGLERLVVVDHGPVIAAGSEQLRQRLIDLRAKGFASVDEVVKSWRAMMPRADEAELVHNARHGLEQRDDGRWAFRYDPNILMIPAGNEERHWDLVSQIEVPTLLIRGELSDVLPAGIAQRVVATIPNCTFVEFEGSGHALRLDQPEHFVETVRSFL